MRYKTLAIGVAAGTALLATAPAAPLLAASHMDAPLITFDDAANTTDVYAFRSQSEDGGVQYLTTAVAVYPFEEPGIGPNNYRFDDRVRYEINIALDDDVAAGRKTISYQFEFRTNFRNPDTILQSFLGIIEDDLPGQPDLVFDENQNLRQTYRVTRVDHRTGKKDMLGMGRVPTNNQGLLTPFYNQFDDGDERAKEGVASEAGLDRYTRQAIVELDDGHRSFAGQRDDGFYADIQSIFDVDFSFGEATGTPTKPFDSQGGFNVHTIVLNIPLSELGGAKLAGVYATTSRRADPRGKGGGKPVYVQVARQGNPLFNEGFVPLRDKDLYSVTDPTHDEELFSLYALEPELATVLGLDDTDREDIKAIFIPDVIKVDLTTGPARLAGDPDFSRLSFIGGDVLLNEDGVEVSGGWPNGRRFGDDVVDIAVNALGLSAANVDGVTENDITFNDVFPYAATPQNGRNHGHHAEFF